MTTTKQHHTAFTVGDRVEVSDGTKRPPEAHCKKLRRWKDRNYKGNVAEVHEPYPPLPGVRVTDPDGHLTLSDDRWPDRSYMIVQHSLTLGQGVTVEKIAA